MADDSSPVLLLCEWAEVINQKLYVMGASIDTVAAGGPVPLALAVVCYIPWQQTNQRQHLRLTLMTEDGENFVDDAGNPVQVEGDIEIGRPPGTKHGTVFLAPLAVKLPPLLYPVGGYRWELFINESLEKVAAFRSIGVSP